LGEKRYPCQHPSPAAQTVSGTAPSNHHRHHASSQSRIPPPAAQARAVSRSAAAAAAAAAAAVCAAVHALHLRRFRVSRAPRPSMEACVHSIETCEHRDACLLLSLRRESCTRGAPQTNSAPKQCRAPWPRAHAALGTLVSMLGRGSRLTCMRRTACTRGAHATRRVHTRCARGTHAVRTRYVRGAHAVRTRA
jgi:hypothetical protein